MTKDYIAGYSFEEWKQIKCQFEKDFENSKKYNRTFGEMISEILKDENYKTFEIKTGLHPNQLYRL